MGAPKAARHSSAVSCCPSFQTNNRGFMITKSLKILFMAILIALPLLLLSYAISYFARDSTISPNLILFIVGAIPIVSFFPGLLARSTSGALRTPKVIWRLVGSSNQNENGSHSGALFIPQVIYRLIGSAHQIKNEPHSGLAKKANFASSLSLVLSGVILWAVSFLV